MWVRGWGWRAWGRRVCTSRRKIFGKGKNTVIGFAQNRGKIFFCIWVGTKANGTGETEHSKHSAVSGKVIRKRGGRVRRWIMRMERVARL